LFIGEVRKGLAFLLLDRRRRKLQDSNLKLQRNYRFQKAPVVLAVFRIEVSLKLEV
jgi:hypothetical protein